MQTYLKILVPLFIFFGESLSIYAELVGEKSNYLATQPFWQIFIKVFLLITFAGAFLVAGYMLGLQAFKSVWVVSVISITSILIVEPTIAWLFFKQIPTIGSVIGFVLGAIGLLASILF